LGARPRFLSRRYSCRFGINHRVGAQCLFAKPQPESNAYSNCNTYCNSHSCADGNAHSDSYANCNSNGYIYTYTYSNTYCNTPSDPDAESDADADSNSNSYTHADSKTAAASDTTAASHPGTQALNMCFPAFLPFGAFIGACRVETSKSFLSAKAGSSDSLNPGHCVVAATQTTKHEKRNNPKTTDRALRGSHG
jgi:hypothetical protein